MKTRCIRGVPSVFSRAPMVKRADQTKWHNTSLVPGGRNHKGESYDKENRNMVSKPERHPACFFAQRTHTQKTPAPKTKQVQVSGFFLNTVSPLVQAAIKFLNSIASVSVSWVLRSQVCHDAWLTKYTVENDIYVSKIQWNCYYLCGAVWGFERVERSKELASANITVGKQSWDVKDWIRNKRNIVLDAMEIRSRPGGVTQQTQAPAVLAEDQGWLPAPIWQLTTPCN